jgi:hypothetical protein
MLQIYINYKILNSNIMRIIIVLIIIIIITINERLKMVKDLRYFIT